jgi:hypothetical protein
MNEKEHPLEKVNAPYYARLDYTTKNQCEMFEKSCSALPARSSHSTLPGWRAQILLNLTDLTPTRLVPKKLS